MVDLKIVELRAVVANLAPAAARATLARGTLDALGLPEVPVAAGSNMGAESHTDTFTDKIAQMAGQNYLLRAPEEDGQALLRRVYEDAEPASLTLLLSKAAELDPAPRLPNSSPTLGRIPGTHARAPGS